ncbi:uncharacterized protein LOC135805386 [Sycon ciliatum]|uniref:uncharacterized protein LOC135805386 n=1 Tax=Sycon ciliatum TaxID=27933 RepID=UPI0031F620CB
MDISSGIFYFLLAIASLAFLYLFRNVIGLLRNALVLWTVAFGGSAQSRSLASSHRMHAYVALSELLDEVSYAELYHLCRGMMDVDGKESASEGIGKLQDVVLGYKFVSLYRDRVDGSLRGMMLLDEKDQEHDGRDIVVFTLGLALFKQQYRGGALPYVFALFRILRSLLLHPQREIYVLTKLFSYKSYLIAMNSSSEAYPRHDAETPAFEKGLIDKFGYSLETSTGKYNAETCVVTRAHVRLERHAAPISGGLLNNAHIKHFVTLNPEWNQGHCLVTCAKVTPWTFISMTVKSAFRAMFTHGNRHANSSGKSAASAKARGLLKRQISDAVLNPCVYSSSFGDSSSFIVTSAVESMDEI